MRPTAYLRYARLTRCAGPIQGKEALSEYREGVTLSRPTKPGQGCFVDAGLWKEVQIDKPLQPGVRVTVKLDPLQQSNPSQYHLNHSHCPRLPQPQTHTHTHPASRSCSFTDCQSLVRVELKRFEGVAVVPAEPREKTGQYWGYTVRIADSLTQLFTQSPFKVYCLPAPACRGQGPVTSSGAGEEKTRVGMGVVWCPVVVVNVVPAAFFRLV